MEKSRTFGKIHNHLHLDDVMEENSYFISVVLEPNPGDLYGIINRKPCVNKAGN